MDNRPTLREIVRGYSRFNAWERQEEKKVLPSLSIEESLHRFFDLMQLIDTVGPDAETIFREKKTRWLLRRQTLQRVQEATQHGTN